MLQRDATEFFQSRSRGTTVSPTAGHIQITGHAPTIIIGSSSEKIDEMIVTRTAAKQAKNFAEADRIRKELLAEGIVLEDGAAGTTWRRA